MKTLVLLDANALIHRAYHALPSLTTPDGKPAGGLFGFSSMLLKILHEWKPDYMVACFDMSTPTFRHKAFKEYKAHRPKTPDDLVFQLGYARDIIRAFGIPVAEKEGFEADDIIATIVHKVRSVSGLKTIIASGDLDTLQLVYGDSVVVYTLRKGVSDTVVYSEEEVVKRFGFVPSALPDYKGLLGDPSDNIPGVSGIGEKTARELIQKYQTIEKIYSHLHEISVAMPRAHRALEGKQDMAVFSKMLATARLDAPILFTLEDAPVNPDYNEVSAIFRGLGFRTLITRLPSEALADSQPALNHTKSLIVGSEEDFSPRRCTELAQLNGNAVVFGAKEIYRKCFRAGASVIVKPLWDAQIAFWLLYPHYKEPTLKDLYLELGLGNEDSTSLRNRLELELRHRDLQKVFEDIELPATPLLASMEAQGIAVDKDYLERLQNETHKQIINLEQEIYKHAGTTFNINSPKQISDILFSRLGIKGKGIRRTKSGSFSTNVKQLQKVASLHPIIKHILIYREINKLKSTYIDSLLELIGDDGRVHAKFHQTGTVTGRLSASQPNMQNIPIRSKLGKRVRAAFVASPGFSFVSLDYSQIELRVAAHLSQDEKMIQAFHDNVDIHSLTASEINNISISEVTPELRRVAKAINFGILYGIGIRALALAAGVSIDRAEVFWQEYFNDFRGISKYVETQKELARSCGYVETLFGRRRYLPDISSANPGIRGAAERQAINFPIQGTATGDLIKMAMIQSSAFIRRKFGEDSINQCRLILQVHDELLFEVCEDKVHDVAHELKNILENVTKLSVPLRVDVKGGKNLSELSHL